MSDKKKTPPKVAAAHIELPDDYTAAPDDDVIRSLRYLRDCGINTAIKSIFKGKPTAGYATGLDLCSRAQHEILKALEIAKVNSADQAGTSDMSWSVFTDSEGKAVEMDYNGPKIDA